MVGATEEEGGAYEMLTALAAEYSAARSVAETESAFTRRTVTTLSALELSQVRISVSQSRRGPASRSWQLEWHRRRVPLSRWTWAVTRRTPALSCTVVL